MNNDVCPWWLGYFLASPIRKLIQNPTQILEPFVSSGMTALDIGPGMGYFTLPMARLVGTSGRVIAVDLQEKMIRSLSRRARRAGLDARIETRICSASSLDIEDLAGKIDFALAFAVLHELPDIHSALDSIARSLAQGGHLLIAEPSGHVTEDEFRETEAIAESVGLRVTAILAIRRSHAALLAASPTE